MLHVYILCSKNPHTFNRITFFLYNLIQKENYFTPGLITVLQKVKLLQLLAWFFLQKFSLCVKVLGNSCARFQFLLVANKTNNFVKFELSFFHKEIGGNQAPHSKKTNASHRPMVVIFLPTFSFFLLRVCHVKGCFRLCLMGHLTDLNTTSCRNMLCVSSISFKV